MSNFLKNKKMWGIAVVVVIVATVLALSFNSANASNTNIEDTATVVSLELAETVDASGTLNAQPFASLDWKTSGIVEAVNVKPGDKVKAGDVLLTLQPASTSANIASAQADLVTAQQNLDDLLNSDSDLAQAVIDMKEAQEDYDSAARYLK